MLIWALWWRRPPFPCMDQLLFDVDRSGGVLNCPLLLIQAGTTHASLLPIPRKKNNALFHDLTR
jgi:hypothetical protein